MLAKNLFRLKKHIFLLIISLLFLLVWPKQAWAATLSLTSKTKNIMADSEFQVEIILDTQNEETLGTDIVINYDSTKLEALKITPGNLYPNYPEAGQKIEQNEGKIYLSGVANFGMPVSESGSLGTITFKGKAPGKTIVSLDWESGSTAKTSIVPYVGYTNLLKVPPESLALSISGKSLWGRFLSLIKSLKDFLIRFAFL